MREFIAIKTSKSGGYVAYTNLNEAGSGDTPEMAYENMVGNVEACSGDELPSYEAFAVDGVIEQAASGGGEWGRDESI